MVLGHWLVRVVITPDGVPEAQYLLALQPGWQAATPLFQVMPLFFLVGGAVNLRSWRRVQAEGRGATEWLRGRAQRLLRPAVPLVLAVAVLGLGAEVLAPGWAILDPWIALIPLWFLAAYLAVTALTPWSAAVHARGHSLALIAVAARLALGVDLLRLGGVGPVAGTQPLVGLPNFVLIWGAVHQLGHMWADGRLPARPLGQAGLVAVPAGWLPVPEAVDLQYWRLRPLWLGAAAQVLAVLVAAMGRLEGRHGTPLPGGAAATLLGVGLVAAGLAALLWAPLAPPGVGTAAAVSGVALFVKGCRALGITWRNTTRQA